VPTGSPTERAVLVGVDLRGRKQADGDSRWGIDESLSELSQLACSAGLLPVGRVVQRRERPHAATFIGPGKVSELVNEVAELAADVVLFDDELSPRHQRELVKALGEDVKVLDRTVLILDVFAQHARTREGALQVELAQYEYRLPRLTRAWTHLARQAGGRAGGATGGVGVRGPGETQLETDRRVISRRIGRLKRDLDEVRAHRSRHRERRRKKGIPTIAIVGYTNAGKSTLLNALSGADVYVADQLFATLDPTTRRVKLPSGGTALFTDTVGFIQRLPTQLIAAFRATLEEVSEADVLLHVIDATHSRALEQSEAVEATLHEIGAQGKPMVVALNKVDLPVLEGALQRLRARFPRANEVSALAGFGLEELLLAVEGMVTSQMVRVDLTIPYSAGDLVSAIHESGRIEKEEHLEAGTRIVGWLPGALAQRVMSAVSATGSEAESAVR